MSRLTLRRLKSSDRRYFDKWWRDRELIALTSGVFKSISDAEIVQYVGEMITGESDYHRMISVDGKVVGHIALVKRQNGWFETQIVIGEKKYWGRGVGTRAIQALLRRASDQLSINKVFLRVRRDNHRAIRVYEKCGFVVAHQRVEGDFMRMEHKV